MSVKYRPRGDRVVFRRIKLDTIKGSRIAVGDDSVEGYKHVVVAVGPLVKDLNIGDEIEVVGQLKLHYAFIPGSPDHLVTREDCVWLVYEDREELQNDPNFGKESQ